MRLYFVMRPVHFQRHFKDVVRLWLEKGHSVHVLFDIRLKKEPLPEVSQEDLKLIEKFQNTHPKLTWEIDKDLNYRYSLRAKDIRTCRDYLRYLTPEYENAIALKERIETLPGEKFMRLLKVPFAKSPLGLKVLGAALDFMEWRVPLNPKVLKMVEEYKPDALIVSPLVYVGSSQVDFIKVAKALKIPSIFCVASWDNLTNKGLVKVQPDLVTVWNEIQKEEAIQMHSVKPEKIVITGAQTFDYCFDWKPTLTREQFALRVGLKPDQPFLLYCCSSKNIAQTELPFIESWIRALRFSSRPILREMGVLIRPYPLGGEVWEGVDHSHHGNVTVWPPRGEHAATPETTGNLYHSIFHSEGVVGLNTSAMLEAGILDKPVYTIVASECSKGQEGTLHFHYLKNGLVRLAKDMNEHLQQLEAGVTGADPNQARRKAFIGSFLRPHGLDKPAAPYLAKVIEALN